MQRTLHFLTHIDSRHNAKYMSAVETIYILSTAATLRRLRASMRLHFLLQNDSQDVKSEYTGFMCDSACARLGWEAGVKYEHKWWG
jgi:hypothetical protein